MHEMPLCHRRNINERPISREAFFIQGIPLAEQIDGKTREIGRWLLWRRECFGKCVSSRCSFLNTVLAVPSDAMPLLWGNLALSWPFPFTHPWHTKGWAHPSVIWYSSGPSGHQSPSSWEHGIRLSQGNAQGESLQAFSARVWGLMHRDWRCPGWVSELLRH